MSIKRKILLDIFDASYSTSKRSVDEKISKITNIVTENQVVDFEEIFFFMAVHRRFRTGRVSKKKTKIDLLI